MDLSTSLPGDSGLRSATRRRRNAGVVSLPLLRQLGIAFLVVLTAGMLFGRFRSDPPIYLSPLDGETNYHVHAFVNGEDLAPDAIRQRYGLTQYGQLAVAPEVLKAIVRHREAHPGAGQPATVRLHFSRSGAPWEVWLWPEG